MPDDTATRPEPSLGHSPRPESDAAMTTTNQTTDAAAARSRRRHRPPRPTGAMLIPMFVAYLALLTWLVLWKLEIPWIGGASHRVVKLVPFADTAQFGASAPSEVLANLVVFVPFGVYLGLVAPSWPWWRATGVVAAASLALEAGQFVMATGSSDVTDLIVNTAGGLVGFAVLDLARRRHGSRATTVAIRLCTAATVLALIAGALLVASPLRYGTPMRGTDLRPAVPMEQSGTPVGSASR